MAQKYTSILNLHNVTKNLSRLEPNVVTEILDMKCQVTEKVHGENFRIGVDPSKGFFVGQRNNIFYSLEDHPHWHKINEQTKQDLIRMRDDLLMVNSSIGVYLTAYGELCGNGMQSGFTYPFDGLTVYFFDIHVLYEDSREKWENPVEARDWLSYMNYQVMPEISKTTTVREALKIDVESMKSEVANEDFIEGVVIKPIDTARLQEIYPLHGRFVVKIKTEKYAEAKKPKKHEKKVTYVSEFDRFVTRARIEHAIERLVESGTDIQNHMSDMKYLVHEVSDDIAKEENDGVGLSKPERGAISKAIAAIYLNMLNEQINDLI